MNFLSTNVKITCTFLCHPSWGSREKRFVALNWGKLQGFLCTPFFKYYLADRYFFHRPLIKVTTEWVAQTTTDIVTRKNRNLPTVLYRKNVYLDNRDFQRCLLKQDSPFYQARTLSNAHLSSSIRNKSSFYTSNKVKMRGEALIGNSIYF